MRVGFIGLGLMGSRMARHILERHGSLVVYNRTKEKARPLIDEGAEWRDSPRAVGESCDIVITMLADPHAVEAVALGAGAAGVQPAESAGAETTAHGSPRGESLLSGMREGALWVDCSTVDPETACRLHDAAAAASVRHVDAPVAGSTPPADKGELIVLTGGSSEDVDEARPFLEPFAKAIHHIGETGRGSAMKLVVNAIIGHTMAGFAEACRLGRALGISEETIHQLVIGSHVAPPYLTPKGPRIRAGDYSPQFPLRLMYKDLALACTSAYRARIPVDALAAATQRFAAAHNAGMGNLDFTAIYRYMNGERNE